MLISVLLRVGDGFPNPCHRGARGWCGLRDRLGSDLGEGSGCAEGANACGRIEAALKERDVVVEAEGAAGRLVGHGDTKGGGVSGPPTVVERLTRWCQLQAPTT